jgi:hypothetical protein
MDSSLAVHFENIHVEIDHNGINTTPMESSCDHFARFVGYAAL